MYDVSAQGVDERVINVRYYYFICNINVYVICVQSYAYHKLH